MAVEPDAAGERATDGALRAPGPESETGERSGEAEDQDDGNPGNGAALSHGFLIARGKPTSKLIPSFEGAASRGAT